MHMRSHPVGLDVWFLVWSFVYFHTSCVRTVKSLARLRRCAGLPDPSLVAYMISTIISWAGSFGVLGTRRKTKLWQKTHLFLPISSACLPWSSSYRFLVYIHAGSNPTLTAKTCLMPYANNKGADRLAQSRSLISTFVVCCLKSMICLFDISKVSRF